MPRTARNPRQLVTEAKQIAHDYQLCVIEVPTPAGTDFVVYRRLPDGRSLRLGKRSSPAGIRTFVARVAGFN